MSVSASKRIRLDPHAIPTKNKEMQVAEPITSSDILMNSTYFSIIIEFIPILNICRYLFAVNKFINQFFHNNNNKQIIKRIFDNETYAYVNGTYLNPININNCFYGIKKYFTTENDNNIMQRIRGFPHINYFKYFIKRISKLKNIPMKEIGIVVDIIDKRYTFVNLENDNTHLVNTILYCATIRCVKKTKKNNSMTIENKKKYFLHCFRCYLWYFDNYCQEISAEEWIFGSHISVLIYRIAQDDYNSTIHLINFCSVSYNRKR